MKTTSSRSLVSIATILLIIILYSVQSTSALPDQVCYPLSSGTYCINSSLGTGSSYTNGTGLGLSETTFSILTHYQLPQTCSEGQTTSWNGSQWNCTAAGVSYTNSTGLNLTGTAFSLLYSFSLPQDCSEGQVTKWDNTAQVWSCDDDNEGSDTSNTTQEMIDAVNQSGLTYNFSMWWYNLNGTPSGFADEIDNDTTYTNGTGLGLSTTTFSILTQYQLPQACTANYVAKWNGSQWNCAADTNESTRMDTIYTWVNTNHTIWDQASGFDTEDEIEALIFDQDNTANLGLSGYNITNVSAVISHADAGVMLITNSTSACLKGDTATICAH